MKSHHLYANYYVLIDLGNWTIDPALIEGRAIWKYRVNSNIYWVDTFATNTAANVYKIPVNSNYTMYAGQKIEVKVYHELPDQHNGVYFPNNQWNAVSI